MVSAVTCGSLNDYNADVDFDLMRLFLTTSDLARIDVLQGIIDADQSSTVKNLAHILD